MSRTLFGARLVFCALASCSFVLLVANSARATLLGNLGPAFNYNVFLFGDDNQVLSDIQGALAVGGNANFLPNGGPSIGSSLSSSTVNLVVGGNLNHTFNSLQGGLLVGGNVNWNSPSISGSVSVNGSANFGTTGGNIGTPVDVVGTYTAPGYYPANANPPSVTPLPFDFNTVKQNLLTNSAGWAGLTPNGTTTVNGSHVTLTATGPQNSLYIFDVHGSDLASSNDFSITAPTGSTVLVNIDGTTDSFGGGLALNGIDSQHVLYNFSDATSLTLNAIAVLGTLVAPTANVDFIGGHIDGSLIAQSLAGGAESHYFPFEGSLDPVPEPATLPLALLGAGLLGAFAFVRSRNSRATTSN